MIHPKPKLIPYIEFKHFGMIRFELSCGQTDTQQTDAAKRFTPATVVCVSNDGNAPTQLNSTQLNSTQLNSTQLNSTGPVTKTVDVTKKGIKA